MFPARRAVRSCGPRASLASGRAPGTGPFHVSPGLGCWACLPQHLAIVLNLWGRRSSPCPGRGQITDFRSLDSFKNSFQTWSVGPVLFLTELQSWAQDECGKPWGCRDTENPQSMNVCVPSAYRATELGTASLSLLFRDPAGAGARTLFPGWGRALCVPPSCFSDRALSLASSRRAWPVPIALLFTLPGCGSCAPGPQALLRFLAEGMGVLSV